MQQSGKTEAIQRILRSRTFARAGQIRRLLAWLGQWEQDHDGSPREQDIARGVFSRDDAFDPLADSIVRKESARLRRKLAEYYALEGARDPVRARLETGYRLTFTWPLVPVDEESEAEASRPCVLVLPFEGRMEPGAKEAARELTEQLADALSRGGDLDIVSMTTARGYDGQHCDVRVFAAETGANFVVEGSLRKLAPNWVSIVRVVDGRRGTFDQGCVVEGCSDELGAVELADFVRNEIMRLRAPRPEVSSVPIQ